MHAKSRAHRGQEVQPRQKTHSPEVQRLKQEGHLETVRPAGSGRVPQTLYCGLILHLRGRDVCGSSSSAEACGSGSVGSWSVHTNKGSSSRCSGALSSDTSVWNQNRIRL